MKNKSIITSMLATAGILLAAGCASFDSRTEEKSYVFNNLPAETKQRLKDGDVRVGDSKDMVYIALGDPSEKRERTTSDGTETVWIYASYHRHYEGEEFTGYRRVVTRKSGLIADRYEVSYVPVSETVYAEHSDEHFRVTFENGEVTEIESTG